MTELRRVADFFKRIDAKSIIFIGESSRKFETLATGIFDEEEVTTFFVDSNKIDNLSKSDLVIWIGFEPKSRRKDNVEILQKLAEITNNILFSSPVPCYAAKNIYFWPSYWCEMFNDLGYDYSTDLKSILWYDSILTPFELEGLVFFEKKKSIEFDICKSAELDLLHPQHGCNHFWEVKGTLLVELKNIAKPLYSVKTFAFFEAIKKKYFYKKVLPPTTPTQKPLASPVKEPDLMELMGFHPGHGCRHKQENRSVQLNFKSYLLKHLSFDRRQRIKAVVPSWIVLRAKRLLLK